MFTDHLSYPIYWGYRYSAENLLILKCHWRKRPLLYGLFPLFHAQSSFDPMTIYHTGCCLNPAHKFSPRDCRSELPQRSEFALSIFDSRPGLIVWGIHFLIKAVLALKTPTPLFTWVLTELLQRAGYTSDDSSLAAESGTEEEKCKLSFSLVFGRVCPHPMKAMFTASLPSESKVSSSAWNQWQRSRSE